MTAEFRAVARICNTISPYQVKKWLLICFIVMRLIVNIIWNAKQGMLQNKNTAVKSVMVIEARLNVLSVSFWTVVLFRRANVLTKKLANIRIDGIIN